MAELKLNIPEDQVRQAGVIICEEFEKRLSTIEKEICQQITFMKDHKFEAEEQALQRELKVLSRVKEIFFSIEDSFSFK